MGKIKIAAIVFIVTALVCGCSVEKTKTEKIKDLEFTVVPEEEIPEELGEKIKEQQENVFKFTYADKGYLYIAQGYGEQETSGYSIVAEQLYETENAIYVHTMLQGPPKEETVSEKPTYPYIVLKLEFIDKTVVFE